MAAKTISPKKEQKERLTLAQLAAYDDILTDALVDHVYFWTNIRKNRSAYHSSRGVREEDVTKILQESVIVNKDPETAEAQLMELTALKKFSANLKTEKEKGDFRRHLRKYINIYLPDCPFEVSTTNRYTVVTQEAAVTARKFVKKNETIKYLSGIQVSLTDEEEEHFRNSRRDFSIVTSAMTGVSSLFLGPARFANHDCGANARLKTTGRDGMEIIALTDIEIGDEITVIYGDHYFGQDNCDCLCKTCEDNCRNGWTAGEDVDNRVPKKSIEEPSEGYSLRRRRRRLDSPASLRTQSETPDVNIRPYVPKKTPRSLSRFKNPTSTTENSPSVEPSLTPAKRKRNLERELKLLASTPSSTSKKRKLEREPEALSPTPSSTPKIRKLEPVVKEEESALSVAATLANTTASPESSSEASQAASPTSSAADGASGTDATSVDDDTIVVEPRLINPTISKLRRSKGGKLPGLLEQAKAGATILIGASTSVQHPALQDDKASVVSELPSEFELKDSTMSITPKNKGSLKRKRQVESPPIDLDHAPAVRIPGDFLLTPRLLAEPESAWINCKICEEPFVQKDAYFTRSSCPRCERHSKLYGYMWPKTDKEGRNDSEERVLDHRTVHRFIDPTEEKTIRRRDRDSTGSRAVTREVSEVDKPDEDEPKSRRKRARR